MREMYLEWCAEIFGVAVRSKLGQLIALSLGLFVFGLVLSMEWGLGGWIFPALIVVASSVAARRVAAARDELWRRACTPPEERTEASLATARGPIGRTTAALLRLADAVDAARDGRLADAKDRLAQVHRELLRPEEAQLADAVEAVITGGGDAPAGLDRKVVTDAWNDPTRLEALQRAWDRAGLRGGRVPKLVRIRLDAERIQEVHGPEAKDLSEEARAVGDEELASELDARAHPTAYR